MSSSCARCLVPAARPRKSDRLASESSAKHGSPKPLPRQRRLRTARGNGIFRLMAVASFPSFRQRNNEGYKRTVRERILVVEDERDIADLIRLHLSDLDFNVTIARDGSTGLREALTRSWDLVILDLRLPGVDGLEICRRIRQRSSHLPVLMLTSKSSELDRVVGLEVGADDYVVKPFSVLELAARVKAILRRSRLSEDERPRSLRELHVGPLTINPSTRAATVRGEPVDLTAKEFDLLLHFARNPGHVFRRTELLDSVWGYGHAGYEHTVNSHINRLRAKVEDDPANPKLIVTVWGVGYKMDATAAS